MIFLFLCIENSSFLYKVAFAGKIVTIQSKFNYAIACFVVEMLALILDLLSRFKNTKLTYFTLMLLQARTLLIFISVNGIFDEDKVYDKQYNSIMTLIYSTMVWMN